MGKRILIAAPVHASEIMFQEYLNSLNHLIIPEDCEVEKFFILHNSSDLKKYLKENEYIEINNNIKVTKEVNLIKNWDKNCLNFVARMRSYLLNYASQNNFDYLFTVDSDILLHPKTLVQLLSDDKAIVGNMIWTKMGSEISAICGEKENWSAYTNNSFLTKPGLYPIGWTCACVLINSKIFNNPNINYIPIPGVDNTECEDYAFCLKILCNYPEEKVWIDTHYTARHLYHEKDLERWLKEKKQYE